MDKITMRAARVNAGMTQQELADKMGISKRTLYDWEKGKRKIKKANLIQFCLETGMKEEDIFLPA